MRKGNYFEARLRGGSSGTPSADADAELVAKSKCFAFGSSQDQVGFGTKLTIYSTHQKVSGGVGAGGKTNLQGTRGVRANISATRFSSGAKNTNG